MLKKRKGSGRTGWEVWIEKRVVKMYALLLLLLLFLLFLLFLLLLLPLLFPLFSPLPPLSCRNIAHLGM